jgi:hypothetical protein
MYCKEMKDQELIDLYEAYASIYETSHMVGPVEMEKDPYTNPKTGKPHTHQSRKDALDKKKDKNRTEEVEAWVNDLVEEGYDLSEYTWDDMYEIYMEEVEQLDETRRDPRGRPASGPMSVYGGKGTPSPDPEGDDNVSRMDRAQRRVKRTQPKAKGMAADALNTRYSARQTGRGGENPSPSDRTAKGHPHSPRRSGRKGLGAETDRGGGNAASRRAGREPGSFREEYDLFDTILEHLVAEGYADTNEAALVIMTNMSEEWRESIVEESRGAKLRAKHGDNPSKKLETKAFRKAMSYDNRDRLPTGTGTEVRGRYLGLSGRARSRAGGETPASSAVGPRGESRTVRSRGGRSAGIGAGENRDRPAG